MISAYICCFVAWVYVDQGVFWMRNPWFWKQQIVHNKHICRRVEKKAVFYNDFVETGEEKKITKIIHNSFWCFVLFFSFCSFRVSIGIEFNSIHTRMCWQLKTLINQNSFSLKLFIFRIFCFFPQAITIVCLVLHYKSLHESDPHLIILASGTFLGYTIILVGLFAGKIVFSFFFLVFCLLWLMVTPLTNTSFSPYPLFAIQNYLEYKLRNVVSSVSTLRVFHAYPYINIMKMTSSSLPPPSSSSL